MSYISSIPSLLYLLITILWLGEFIFFPGKLKQKGGRGQNTFYTILIIILLNIIFSILLVFIKLGNLPGTLAVIIRYTGLIIYFIGLLIRYYSIFLLGQKFTRGV